MLLQPLTSDAWWGGLAGGGGLLPSLLYTHKACSATPAPYTLTPAPALTCRPSTLTPALTCRPSTLTPALTCRPSTFDPSSILQLHPYPEPEPHQVQNPPPLPPKQAYWRQGRPGTPRRRHQGVAGARREREQHPPLPGAAP